MTIHTEPTPKDRSDQPLNERQFLRELIKYFATFDPSEGDTKDLVKQGVVVANRNVLHFKVLKDPYGKNPDLDQPTLAIDVFTTRGDFVESLALVDNDTDFMMIVKAGKKINDEIDLDTPRAIDAHIDAFFQRYDVTSVAFNHSESTI